ncbi:long-chain fatty acid--CoA ligase [Desulfosarcina ovata subsp. sediminis]|uniref:Long-chain fatty acid--CoA ligase n=1 Tax=Desulfosarcina ovata subsp. sediminis TaxID=885957 RepID=A0A5K8A1E7_9BACT|nr:class I adenylate-forming enzyme family protein [Desulfosarcina ovata]BBO86204.1 long-chain fatty acid--CoA ligase [Desulfosarcina ovata subsp. sediminis]
MPVHTDNIYVAFERMARSCPSHSAVIYLGSRFSYSEVRVAAERLAGALIALGVRPGEKVVIYLPNSVHWIVSWLGILRAGGVCVPVSPIYLPHDLAHIVDNSGASMIVCADTNFGYVQRVMSESLVENVVVARMADMLPGYKRTFGWFFNMIPRGRVAWDGKTYHFRKLLHNGITSQLPELPIDPLKTAEMLYTGGTTQSSKGVPISHRHFLVSAREQIRTSRPLIPSRENIVLCHSPLFHILGQTCGLAILLVGGTLLIQPSVNLDATFDAIARFKVRALIAVPSFYRMMLEHERLDQYNLTSVDYWFSAGDVLPLELNRRWESRFGKIIHQGYGCTETCGGVAMCPVDRPFPANSVGHVVSSKKVKIVDPIFLDPVKAGEPGELLVHSENMPTAYVDNAKQTREAFIDLDGLTWYRTSDVMRMDNRGNLFFVDRTTDTINHDGHQVSASEIEAVLQEHPAVVATCVVGVEDKTVGERIKACVVLKSDIKGITGYELIKWCRKRLLPHKVPQYIEFRDMLPKSKLGKLLRREVREEERQRAEA